MKVARVPGIRDSRARTMVACLVLAVILHLPFTPLPFVLRWLAVYLNRSDTSWDFKDDSVIIPISLVEDVPQGDPPTAPAATSTSAPDEVSAPAPHPPREAHLVDAGAPDTADTLAAGSPDGSPERAAPDGSPERAAPPDAAPPRHRVREAGVEAGGAVASADAGADSGTSGPAVKDTLSLVGGLRSAIKGKPNVTLVFWFSTMRAHPLGPLVGSLLSCNPQWRDFLGDDVDPLQDFDGIMLAGPRMSDTSKLTVLAQSRMEDAKVQKIMDHLARTTGGGVIEGAVAGVHAIRFRADRADRIALTHPRNMIIVTPPEGFEQLRDQREPLSLPGAHGQAMSLTLVTPWRPLRALGLRLPETLSEIRVNIFAASDGGVNIQIEFDDLDEASAAAHAAEVTEQVRSGNPLLSDIEFVAQGNHLAAQTHLMRITGAIALGFIRSTICPAGGGFDGGRGLR